MTIPGVSSHPSLFPGDMKQEKWLRSLQKITMLKLRTGYGRSGNLGGISSYTTLNTVTAEWYCFGEQFSYGYDGND